tara:strand:- start:4239 stop:4925 length:687 start_codon:yes stop_codon:yes gene_type:complete
MGMKIFYDGVNIKKYIGDVDGVTTNTSYIAQAGITNYKEFMQKSLAEVGGKPISFQVTSREIGGIEQQARYISSLGDNVYVKIPIILPQEESTGELIKSLSKEGMKINVTCIHTEQQIVEAFGSVSKDSSSIISVFAGGISDAANYPNSHIEAAVKLTENHDNIEVLWAGCQRVLSIVEADDMGCDIITVPDGILNKASRMSVPLYETSVKKSELFFSDGDKLRWMDF